ncbi:hypothetical protein [Thiomonas sp.]|uniref:hypothetical protein n=1 Tax=Thiomonas sp. TaxID=2047785 RepID=UPI00338E5B3E
MNQDLKRTLWAAADKLRSSMDAATAALFRDGFEESALGAIPRGWQVGGAFASVAEPFYARIVTNKAQARSLAQLRDTLLPRLISGKLRFPEATEQIEEALT